MHTIYKYPRTQHIEGSRLQPGDEDLEQVRFRKLAGENLVVEEKMDGANSAISFDDDGRLLLQSRGHYLTGGEREKHFALFKTWATTHSAKLHAVLGSRYVMYGEWLYAKHTIYYNALPHYFMEFDILDKEENRFLDWPARQKLLAGLDCVQSVRVLHEGPVKTLKQLTAYIGESGFITGEHILELRERAREMGLKPEQIERETDRVTTMEGLYIKHEANGEVIGRYKYVRASFLTTVVESGTHWLKRPVIPNLLLPDVDLFVTESSDA